MNLEGYLAETVEQYGCFFFVKQGYSETKHCNYI